MDEKKTNALNDQDMSEVNGGFKVNDIAEKGFGKDIYCPRCGNMDKKLIQRNNTDNQDILNPKKDLKCLNCGFEFNYSDIGIK